MTALSYRPSPLAIGNYLPQTCGVNTDPKALGQIVRDRRLDLGLSQVEVAGRAGVSEPAYRSLETGRTRATDRTLSLVSKALEWPSTALRDIRDGKDGWKDLLHSSGTGADEPRSELSISASGVNLDELRDLDPDAYDLIVLQAQAALDRARRRIEHDER